jgi:hypothetical protein
LRASSETLRREVEGYLSARFGLPSSLFASAQFTETGDGEIWVSTDMPAGIRTRRPPGLRALRRTPSGLKPTSAFLVSVGPYVTASRVSVEEDGRRSLLLGQRAACPHSDGYVALTHRGDVLGCALVADGTVHALIPTGRRRELLGILDA